MDQASIIAEITNKKNVKAKSLEDDTDDEDEMQITPMMAMAAKKAEFELLEHKRTLSTKPLPTRSKKLGDIK
jgi:hypothetical protein